MTCVVTSDQKCGKPKATFIKARSNPDITKPLHGFILEWRPAAQLFSTVSRLPVVALGRLWL
jgi:hypothetical protein